MYKKIALAFISVLILVPVFAQDYEMKDAFKLKRTTDPFLFSVTTLTQEDSKWSLNYSGSYGERVQGPFGYDGVSQQVSVKGYLGKQFTLYANAGIGISRSGAVSSTQQAEILHDFIGGRRNMGLRLGLGLGINNDFSNAKSLLGRITGSFDATRFKASGNLLLEHTFTKNRDEVDVITNLGFHYRLLGRLYAGFEAVGEDLEGFWDEEEAEGGAKLMVGPSLNMTSKNSGISFSLSGGPVIYATQNQVINQEAIRQLPSQAGLIVRASVIFKLSGS